MSKKTKNRKPLSGPQWAEGYRIGVDAAAAHAEFQRLKRTHGNLTNEAIVEAARDESSPLHNAFEWNDSIAGQRYRLTQAGEMKRALVFVHRREDEKREHVVRAWVPVHRLDDGDKERKVNTWVPFDEAMADPALRKEVLDRALAEAQAWRARYQDLVELSNVFSALDAVAS